MKLIILFIYLFVRASFLVLHHIHSCMGPLGLLFTCSTLWFPLGGKTGVCVCVFTLWDEGKERESRCASTSVGLQIVPVSVNLPSTEQKRYLTVNKEQVVILWGVNHIAAHRGRNTCFAVPNDTRAIYNLAEMSKKIMFICWHLSELNWVTPPPPPLPDHIHKQNRMLGAASYQIMLPLTCSPGGQK